MALPHADRRQDHTLRSAIDRMQQDADQLTNKLKIYQSTVDELCHITGSRGGLVIECLNQTGPFQLLVTHPAVAPTVAHTLPYELEQQTECLNVILQRKEAQIFFGPQLEQLNLSPLGIPPITHMIALPLVHNNNTYAIIALFNSPIPYDLELAKRCAPLLSTSTCIQQSIQASEVPQFNEQPWCSTLHNLVNHTHMPIICINAEHEVIRFNHAAEQSFGVTAESATGRAITEFLPERFPNEHRILTFNPNRIKEKATPQTKLTGRQKNGNTFPMSATPLLYREKGALAILLMLSDNSKFEAINRQQYVEIERFKAVSDLAPIGIIQTNKHWEAEYVNSRWCDICGYGRNDVMQLGWINAIHPDDVSSLLEQLRDDIVIGNEFSEEYRLLTPIGNTVWVQLQARPLLDHSDVISGFIATIMDITYRKITDEKLRKMAENDALTGLTNRALFHDRLEHALSRIERHGPFAILCLDLDGFKNINDTLGHDAGDLLLIEVAKRLLDCVRSEDTVARFGGDEFMILVEGLVDASVAANVAEKVLTTLRQPMLLGEQEVFISTSIGITFATGQSKCTPKNLLKQADIALYRAKEEGRNNYQYFSPELEEASKSRLLLGNSLYRAMERGEFEVFYQIQATTSQSQPMGTEALLRWRHPEQGLLPPQAFIPLLEESGLIAPVSRWLWQQAFREHKRWIEQSLLPPESHISINLSPRQLRDAQLIRNLENAIQEAGLSAGQVVVELTESSLITDSNTTRQTLSNIKALGVQLALDDFGTGYSSLTYLKRFSIDIIKIDQSFVRDILTDSEDAAIVQAVLALSQSLSLTTVAEGVDTEEKLTTLAQWGCELHQGYLLNKPCAAKQLSSKLEKLCSYKAAE